MLKRIIECILSILFPIVRNEPITITSDEDYGMIFKNNPRFFIAVVSRND